ncbi:MAG: response regulator [Planctomycetota bacterium]
MSSQTTILVVDDIPLMRTILSKYVRSIAQRIFAETQAETEIQVLEAGSGQAALDALRRKDVDLVFLDLMMPEMDGLTFLAIKEKDPKLAPVPVVVCTALGEKETLSKALELGAVSYVLKPFTLRAIEEKLRHAIGLIPERA